MGVLYTKNLYTQNGWVPTQIEMFLRVHTGPSGMRGGYATYESAGNYSVSFLGKRPIILTFI